LVGPRLRRVRDLVAGPRGACPPGEFCVKCCAFYSDRGHGAGATLPAMSYATTTGPRLSSRDALRAVLAYADEFVETGDLDVLFVLSGGAVMDDGDTVDAAIWVTGPRLGSERARRARART
jgi:hypothetical protein